jgi:hypothetical protein
MLKWFNKQDKLIRCLLLLIPGVNWVVEILIRWPQALKEETLIKYILAIIATIPSGIILGWVDLIWTLLFNELLLTK